MIETERLILRGWEDRDRAPFHALCSDPSVMAYIGPVQSRTESDAAIDRHMESIDHLGHGFWALEGREDGAFLGFCGLKAGPVNTPLEGEMEIGWRIRGDHWGKGYAREAANASLDWAWANTSATEIMAITVLANVRSWGLMERLGMTRVRSADFDHPTIPDGSPLKACITYSISRPEGR